MHKEKGKQDKEKKKGNARSVCTDEQTSKDVPHTILMTMLEVMREYADVGRNRDGEQGKES